MAGYGFPVDRTAILMFASALGETNRAYYDSKYAKEVGLGEVIAPPTFTAAGAHWNPNYGLRGVRRIPQAESRPSPARSSSAGGDEGGSVTRLLHGEQRFDYHKPLHPGTVLTATSRAGESWTKEGRRGGRLHFNETITEYRDEKGELVVTATGVGIMTEKAVEES